MGLGENILEKRKAMKLSQEYIAERLGVSRQAVSKWETGQTEPNAKNLVQLAQLFGITVSELIEPEKVIPVQAAPPEQERPVAELLAVAAYTGAVVMSTIRTNGPGFPVFVSVMILIPAVIMAFFISRKPKEIRLKMAVKELLYCIALYCIAAFVSPRIGNVFSSVLIAICAVMYAKYIRFPDWPDPKKEK